MIETLRRAFAAHADPARAAAMQAYMKSALPFHGIPAPLRRRLAWLGLPDGEVVAPASTWIVSARAPS